MVVNLYPFEETVADPDADPALAVERIDVGGPAMVRAAAKNHAWVAVVCDPADYSLVESALTAGGTTLPERRTLAARAFARTAAYDTAVTTWMGQAASGFPERLAVGGRLRQALRYGENPHQGAAFYASDGPEGPWGLGAAQVAGKELSYNNLLDADAALALAAEHGGRLFATIVKHTNPCGAAFGATLEEAYAGALDGDPVSAFGGVVGLSRPLDAATAKRIAGIFTEVVVAPGFDEKALAVLAGKPSLRLVRVDLARPARWLAVRSVAGGLLAQEPDPGADDPAGWALQAGDPPGPEVLADLALAWSVAGHVKSNAIVLARDGRVVGVGAGQQSRVDSVRIAVAKAGERARGAAAGSDAFFPFADGVEALADAGVLAVAQPGGSVRDPEVTAARPRPVSPCSTPAAATSATDRHGRGASRARGRAGRPARAGHRRRLRHRPGPAWLLAERGADVVCLDVAAEALEAPLGYVRADLTDDGAVRAAVAAAAERLGGLDIVVNNAGVGAVGTVEANLDDEWHRVFDVNVLGIVRVTRAPAPPACLGQRGGGQHLLDRRHRRPSRPRPVQRHQGAVQSLTLAMAADHLAEGIRVCCVNPGTADTPWVRRLLAAADDPEAELRALQARQPSGRLVSAGEVAAAIAYLASPLAGATTGTVLADGGMQGLRCRPRPPPDGSGRGLAERTAQGGERRGQVGELVVGVEAARVGQQPGPGSADPLGLGADGGLGRAKAVR